jgi:hypothetical protein
MRLLLRALGVVVLLLVPVRIPQREHDEAWRLVQSDPQLALRGRP